MKNINLSKKQKYILFILFVFLFLGINIVSAATSADLKFCEYGGVRRTLKIVGILIVIIKCVVPLILTITGMITFAKTVISGKEDDMKASIGVLAKKIVAGMIVFCLPTVIDYAFDTLVGYDDSSYTACTTCLLDINNCVIPEKDPETYVEN